MPFKEQAVITLENFGKETVEIRKVTLYTGPWKWDRHSMHFGTSWHQFTRLQTGNAKENDGRGGPSDINYVELGGRGVYAGDGVAVFNTMYGWWGEGDEKVYVDGRPSPRTSVRAPKIIMAMPGAGPRNSPTIPLSPSPTAAAISGLDIPSTCGSALLTPSPSPLPSVSTWRCGTGTKPPFTTPR